MLGYTCDGYGGREGHEDDEGRTRGGWSSRCWMNVKRECLCRKKKHGGRSSPSLLVNTSPRVGPVAGPEDLHLKTPNSASSTSSLVSLSSASTSTNTTSRARPTLPETHDRPIPEPVLFSCIVRQRVTRARPSRHASTTLHHSDLESCVSSFTVLVLSDSPELYRAVTALLSRVSTEISHLLPDSAECRDWLSGSGS
jgi:hypothetical protein